MVYADLHVHTTRSDGHLELEAVPTAARRAGVDVVAVTDHDRLQPFDGPTVERDGVTLVHGIELRVERETGQRLDLLGYGVESTSALESLVGRIQDNRIERGQAIVDRVEARLGIDLGVTVTDGFGRPHVARAIDAHPDADYDYADAFANLIGSDGPCFVAREIPAFDRGLEVLSEACQIVSLAHPLRYRDPDGALEIAPELDAVERWYPYDRDVTAGLEAIDEVLERHDLLATGGSDAHDDELGRAGLSRAAFDRLGLS